MEAAYTYRRADGIRITLTPESVSIAAKAGGETEKVNRVRVTATGHDGTSAFALVLDSADETALDAAADSAAQTLIAEMDRKRSVHEQLRAHIAKKGTPSCFVA